MKETAHFAYIFLNDSQIPMNRIIISGGNTNQTVTSVLLLERLVFFLYIKCHCSFWKYKNIEPVQP